MLRSIRLKILVPLSCAIVLAMTLSAVLANQLSADYFSSAQQESTLFILVVAVLTAGLSALILMPILSLILTRPLERLTAAMRRLSVLSSDDDPPRLAVESDDEIGELSCSFNKMANQLVESMRQADVHAQALEAMAHYDFLTRLPNRTYFLEQAQRRLDRAAGDDHRLALLFLDLDRFKHVNDTYGHRVGDKLLSRFAERLLSQIRAPDYPARIGGDEFLVLIDDIGRIDTIGRVCRRIIGSMQGALTVDDHQLVVGVSIGVAIFPEDGTDIEALLMRADIAMYEAKQTGRNSYRLFKDALNLELQQRCSIETQLRRALSGEEIEVHLQPKYAVDQGKICGFEAFARWRSSNQPPLEASEFIAVAEDSGLIVKLGEGVLRRVCETLASLQRNGHFIPVAVNVSRLELAQAHFGDHLLDILHHYQVPANLLELEINEKIFYSDSEMELEILRRLSAAGVRISIDNFGKGCSLLSRLQEVPVHRLKIDPSFVGELPDNKKSLAVASSIMSIARNLDLDVIAGGVERREQLDALRSLGVDEVQGFLFSPVVPFAAAEQMLTHQT